MPQRYPSLGHQAFRHDTLSSLGYDWERVGDPEAAPRWPFKVYLPRDTEDVVRAVREAGELGQRLTVRAHGHSSNGLVTAEGGAVLLTELMDQLVEIDERNQRCTMSSGAVLSEVDARLAEHGLGLAVIGDHADLTAGGFASVGGISPASHRYGLFIDTVVELEYVDWDGVVHRCGRSAQRDRFLRVLGGTGRHGVITTLTVEVVRIDKRRTVLRNDRFITTELDEFLAHSAALVRDPGDALFERGLWVDLPVGDGVRLGQFSAYRPTTPHPVKSLRNRAAYAGQRLLGYSSAKLPPPLGKIMKYFAVAATMRPPSFASTQNIERFADRLLDATVGDPTRMLIVLAPAARYEQVARELIELCLAQRQTSRAVTVVSLYVKAIRSAYLSGGADGERHAELTLYLGVDPVRMTDEVLDGLVRGIDDVAIEHGAFRYMHTRTSGEQARRRRVDPNTMYDRPDAGHGGPVTNGQAMTPAEG